MIAVVKAAAGRGRALAGSGAHVLGDGVDDALAALIRRRVGRALRPEAALVDRSALVDALGSRPGSNMSPWIGAGAARLARTGRAAKAMGGRTPLGLAVRFGPAVYSAVSGNLRGLDAALAYLVTRARQASVDADPERVRRVVVQALAGDPIDADADADHGRLIRVWLGAAGRRAMPFGLDRISGLRSARTPEAVAAVLDAVDIGRLAGS